MKALELKDVCFEYEQMDSQPIKAVDGVSFSVEEGEFVAIIGHNGSGKSTLAKLFNGLLMPTQGTVKVFGIDTSHKADIFRVREKVGMVFQNPDNQMIASVVEDDIAFGPENLGVPREEIRRRVDWALKCVGMTDSLHSTPFKMSGGQKQRIAIAGVLAILPKVLVFDESTAMLDPQGRQEVMQVAQQLNKEENMTVITITHYMDEALAADRLIVLNDGKVVADDKPQNVFSDYKRLKEINLSIPIVTQYARRLIDAGIPVNPNVMTRQQLEEELCQLL